MDDVRKPDKADTISDLGWPLAEVSSEATRRLCEQGQTVAKTMTDWSTEVSQFLSHRAGRNSEAIGRVTKCQSLPEVFAIQVDGSQQQHPWRSDGANQTRLDMAISRRTDEPTAFIIPVG